MENGYGHEREKSGESQVGGVGRVRWVGRVGHHEGLLALRDRAPHHRDPALVNPLLDFFGKRRADERHRRFQSETPEEDEVVPRRVARPVHARADLGGEGRVARRAVAEQVRHPEVVRGEGVAVRDGDGGDDGDRINVAFESYVLPRQDQALTVETLQNHISSSSSSRR